MEENEKIKTEVNSNSVNEQNNNSENKPRNKKLTIVLISLIIVLILAIGVCAGLWFAGDTTKIINNSEEKQEQSNSKKIDETKPWVYDADYGKDKENKIVDDYYNFSKDVIVPYININSKDAEKINNEIKNIYEEVYSKFGSIESYTYNGVISNDQTIYKVEYQYYENENILSVVLRVSDMAVNGGAGLSKLYTYNFNLDTLNIATFEEMAKLCGFNSTSEVTDKINKWEKAQNDNPDGLAGTMMGVVDGQYFIDANKKLNFVYVIGAAGTYYTPAIVEKDKDVAESNGMNNIDESQFETTNFSSLEQFKNLFYKKSSIKTNVEGVYNFYELCFDKEGKPTIKVGTKSPEQTEVFFVSQEVKNIKTDVAAGTVYVTFDFTAWSPGGDTTGAGTIRYSNVNNNSQLGLKATINIDGRTVEYSDNGNYVEVIKLDVTGYTFKDESTDNAEEITVYGKNFSTFPGTSARNRVYYIDEYDNLCKTYPIQGGGYNTDVLARNVKSLKVDMSEVKLHIYPISSKFSKDDIYKEDECTYYENIENTEQSNDSSNNLYVKRTLTNEYGDATKTIDVYGKQFIQIVGSTGRTNIYYINKNNQLCRTNLVDLSTQILASDVKDIQIDQNNIIHAYPIGDSFMNNIAMEDGYVKYENIN